MRRIRLRGLPTNKHWQLKGPQWTLGIGAHYSRDSFDFSGVGVAIELQEPCTVVVLVFRLTDSVGEFNVSWVLIFVEVAWLVESSSLFLAVEGFIGELPRAGLFCFLNSIISLSIFMEIYLSWSETSLRFLLLVLLSSSLADMISLVVLQAVGLSFKLRLIVSWCVKLGRLRLNSSLSSV